MYYQIQSYPTNMLWVGQSGRVADVSESFPINYNLANATVFTGFIETMSDDGPVPVYSLVSCVALSSLIETLNDASATHFNLVAVFVPPVPFTRTATEFMASSYSLPACLVRTAFNETLADSASGSYSLLSVVA